MGVGARGMLAFGGNLTAFNLLNYFSRNFDNILIGRVLGCSLGIYTKAYGLLMLPIAQINFPMAAVLLRA
jgi:PST family polysaccharide transporter